MKGTCGDKLRKAEAEIERLRAEVTGSHRTIWMLLKENGGAVVLNKDTKESYPGDDAATIEITEQPNNGCSILRAYQQQLDTSK